MRQTALWLGLLTGSATLARPEVWMMPPGSNDGGCFRELFEQPDAWAETRGLVNVLGYADHVLNRQFTDQQLAAWLPMIETWGLKLGLEVGAVKPWGPTGEQCFKVQSPKWDRFESLGAKVYAIAMDEPLCCVRKDLKQPDSYAVDETAAFIALVRQTYPDLLIGDIEPYPFLSVDELTTWIDALQAKLAALNVRGLDFFRVDVDWANFTTARKGSWPEVRKIEEACRQRKLPFSLIYWAADYPALAHKGLADDSAWYVSLLGMGQDYAMVGGRPDQVVIESWVGAPSRAVPDDAEWSFTRSVRDFCRRLLAD